ncbi:MAG: hypothetical protein IJC07_04105 [Clostridia bacterium]|nr:hypothetical protein [Clostridia bacterium]
MEELKNEQTEVCTQPSAEEENAGGGQTEVSLGKFKDAKSLLDAYNSLESEFTKRCQKLKELEKRLVIAEKATPPQKQDLADENKPTIISDEMKKEILEEYFSGVLGGRNKAIVLDGVGAGVKTPELRPKTIKEAGDLARQILSK